jgi:hypothetical protein
MFVECVNTVLKLPYISNLVFQFLFDSSCKCGGAKLFWICEEIWTDVGL